MINPRVRRLKPAHRQPRVTPNSTPIRNLADQPRLPEARPLPQVTHHNQSPKPIRPRAADTRSDPRTDPAPNQVGDQPTHQRRRPRQQPAVHQRRTPKAPSADQLVQKRHPPIDSGLRRESRGRANEVRGRLDPDPPAARPRRQVDQHPAITRPEIHDHVRPRNAYLPTQDLDDDARRRAPGRKANRRNINHVDAAATPRRAPARHDETGAILARRDVKTDRVLQAHQPPAARNRPGPPDPSVNTQPVPPPPRGINRPHRSPRNSRHPRTRADQPEPAFGQTSDCQNTPETRGSTSR